MLDRQAAPAIQAIRLARSAARLSGDQGPFDIFSRAQRLEAAGRDVIHLELGEADFDTPDHIKAAAIEAISSNQTRYAPAAGIADLREDIARQAALHRSTMPFAPEHVVVGPGVKPLLFNVLSVLIDPGDEVVVLDPCYPTYRSCARFLEATIVPVALDKRSNFALDVDRLAAAITDKTRVLLLNSPNNPTGSVLSLRDLEAIAEIAIDRNIAVISDEIYSQTLYDGEFRSIVALDEMRDRTIVLDGFSKAYAMTGWRLGYAILPCNLTSAVSALAQNTYSCTATFVQRAGEAALCGPDEPAKRMVRILREQRDVMIAGLNAIPGIACSVPDGAFYAFPDVSAITADDVQLAAFILEEAGVAVLPGSSCGEGGRGHLRFSYGASLARIEAAVKRVREAIPKFRGLAN